MKSRTEIILRSHGRALGARADFAMAVCGFLLFAAIALWPVLHTKLLPVSDYVNHLARCQIIALGGSDALLAQFYTIDWRLIPNLAMDLVVPPLAHVVDIYTAGQVFLVVTLLLLLVGPHLVHRALFGRWSSGPLIAGLFLYNGSIETGAVNYLFGIGVALFGLAAWIALRRGSALLRGAVSAALVIVLYVCHFGALGIYGVALLGFEIWQARSEAAVRRHWRRDLAAFLLPFFAVPVLALLGPGGDAMRSGVLRWTLYDKLYGFFFALESQSVAHLPDAIIGFLLLALALWSLWRGLVRIHPAGLAIAGVAAIAFLVTPVDIMTANGADVRQPLGDFFVLVGFLEWRLLSSRARRNFAAAVVALLALRVAIVEHAWSALKPNLAEMRQSFALIGPGSKILIAEAENHRYPPGHTLHYLPCQAIIERSSLCSVVFSDPRQQVLVVKPAFRAMTGGYDDDPPKWSELLSPPPHSPETPSGRIYWVDWTDHYDYLYLLSTEPGDPNPLSDQLTRLFDGGHFQLYAIRR
jgi:hypothetical protein